MLFLQCTSTIPVYRTAQNVEPGKMRHAGSFAIGCDNNPAKYSTGNWKTPPGPNYSAIMFSEMVELGLTNKFNAGSTWFISPGEIGLLSNVHYQMSNNKAPRHHTAGLYFGGIISALDHNRGTCFLFAPQYLVDFENNLFLSGRYIHRYFLDPYEITIGGTIHHLPENQSTFEAIGGYKLPKGKLIYLTLGYNQALNWWHLWLGITISRETK